MSHSTTRTFNAQMQNNNQLQRPLNIGGQQNAGGLLQSSPNIPIQPINPQNTASLPIAVFNEIQQYIDLVEGVESTDLFTEMGGAINLTPLDDQLSILGYSFP
ncbi:hypothetical protein F8M41_006982 [Gigaspora margarita]|uniref:Uncharacterized protein n=1 Tax=Gigaspora margarita TaxID=4874 RepID=A0A8H4A5M7_GIGMA|nr:hypothetical protein F8M41_006982 [Gigaspora margarita]